MIPNRFAHIQEKQKLEELKPQIEDTSIVFCPESKEIITHRELYGKPRVGILGTPPPKTNGYDYVDMGEAGIWATCNVGANSPEEYGLYFAWGETQGYTQEQIRAGERVFDEEHYKFGKDLNNPTKYNSSDGLTTLEPEDDAAHVIMGGDWRMPTEEEYKSLAKVCTQKYIKDYNGTGVEGRLFTLKSDPTKQLFFPTYSNYAYNGHWSSSMYLFGKYAYAIYFEFKADPNDYDYTMDAVGFRASGYKIRAILDSSIKL